MKVDDPITDVIVCTTVRTRDDSFPLMDAVRPPQEDLDEFVNVAVPGEAAAQPAAPKAPAGFAVLFNGTDLSGWRGKARQTPDRFRSRRGCSEGG